MICITLTALFKELEYTLVLSSLWRRYIPISHIDNSKLYLFIKNAGKKYCDTDQKEAYLALKTQKNVSDLCNEFINFFNQNKNPEHVSNCKYYDLNKIRPDKWTN